jgi:hypothetical protein
MMAATRSTKRKTERLPEDQDISKVKQTIRKLRNKQNEPRERKIEDSNKAEKTEREPVEKEDEVAQSIGEIPYAKVAPLPVISRSRKSEQTKVHQDKEMGMEGRLTAEEPLPIKAQVQTDSREIKRTEISETSYENRAPLQADEKARELVKGALKNPISITTEDLLNVSESARQELRKLLTKKRVEKPEVAFVVGIGTDTSKESMTISVESLPGVSYEILEEETKGVPKGALIIGDPVVQYLSTLQPGEKAKKVVVASESQGLRAVYPLINSVGEVESLLDSGSQIVSMAKNVAIDLEISWDPDITVHMQSANRSLEQTLGLAKNVPFLFGHITVYLQVHIMEEPAYKVLLGRPFDTVTESLVKNEKDGGQHLTLTDPNSGERCVMHTHERGRPPSVIRKPIKEDFR